MKHPPASPSRLGHLRSLITRFAFILLVGASFALMLLGKAETGIVARARMLVADSITSAVDVMSRPASGVASVVDTVHELSTLREENLRLRAEIERLERWQTVARKLEAQNDALKSLLNFVPEPTASFVTGRVVADTGGAYAQSLLVTAGARQLVDKGQAVLSGEGLVGRISEAGSRSSRVLLLTDINSRVPVSVGNARQRAILSGDNTDHPRLMFLRSIQAVSPGDRVVTSGDAGVFPPGVPIGVVSQVNDSDVRVEPFFQRDRLEYVRVVDYGLSGILSDIVTPKESCGKNK